jgi:hypothetical protein
VKLDHLKRDVIDGMRPGKSILLALIVAAERAGIEEIGELPVGVVRLIFETRVTPEEAVDAVAKGLKWCSWHQRFEPQDAFSISAISIDTSRDCTAAHRERYQQVGRPGR